MNIDRMNIDPKILAIIANNVKFNLENGITSKMLEKELREAEKLEKSKQEYLKMPEPDQQPFSEKSPGAQGQAKKPGSHRESRHR